MLKNMMTEIKNIFKSFEKMGTMGQVMLIILLLAVGYYSVSRFSDLGFNIHTIATATTENLVGSSNKNLVYYSMDGCPHCKKFDETWEQLKEKNSTKIGLRKVDSKSCGGECQNNNVQGFPTILLCDSSNSKVKECPTRDLDGVLKFLQENE